MAEGTLRVARVILGSRSNGPGLRDVFWVAGCGIHCPGCINPEFLDPDAGRAIRLESLVELMARRASRIEGISISGGEPTEQPEGTASLAHAAQALGLSVVVFTGRTYPSCNRDPRLASLLSACDLLVAGPFMAARPSRGQRLLGSTNQSLHFLTERYDQRALAGVVDGDFFLTGDKLVWTGLPTTD